MLEFQKKNDEHFINIIKITQCNKQYREVHVGKCVLYSNFSFI